MKPDAESAPSTPMMDVPPGPQDAREGDPGSGRYPPGFEENDTLRSEFIRSLTLRQVKRDPGPQQVCTASETIPKIVVRFWHDSSHIPPDVRSCLESWDSLQKHGLVFRMFDDRSATAYIKEFFGRREVAAFSRCWHPAMRSDYLRMCFLLREGGLYVDADDILRGDGWEDLFRDSTLKLQAFCYDIVFAGMVPSPELRRPDLPTEGRIFYINNNPIAAPPGHPVLQRAVARATDSLLGDELAPDIQATTGPGNLSAALAAHARELQMVGDAPDFELLFDWEQTAEPCWDLAYRDDGRNWRNAESHRRLRASGGS